MTFKIPEDISIDDVYQWLNDSYVLRTNGEVLGFNGDVERRHGETYAFFHSLSEGTRGMLLPMSEIELHWPVCGAINVSYRNTDYAVYIRRNQRRQWRRAFNQMCVSVQLVGGWSLYKRGDIAWRTLRDRGIVELFDPTYYSPRIAMRMIREEGAVSVALSPQVVLVGDGKGQYAVYYRTTLVGGYRDGIFTPTVTDSYGASMAEQLLGGTHND